MFFIAWSGWGLLTLFVMPWVGFTVAAVALAILNATGHPGLDNLAFAVGAFAAAAANWDVGKRLNSRPPRELVDARTGQRVLIRNLSRLFWIRMEYWSIPMALAGIALLISLFVPDVPPG